MGDSENPVNLWRWGADHTDKVVELNAKGSDLQEFQAETGQEVHGEATYHLGQYRMVMKRALSTPDNQDIQFRPGQFIPMGFFVWDGSNHETGKQMAMSSWYFLLLEPPLSKTVYAFPVVAVIVVTGAEWWFLRRLRRNKGTDR